MNTVKTTSRITMTFLTLVAFTATLLVRTAAGFFQGSDGTPTPEFTIDVVSLLIGIAAGGLGIGVPALVYARHTKTGHVTLLKRTEDVQQGVRASPPSSGGPEVPEGTEAGKHTKSGHVSLLKRTEDVEQAVRASPPSSGSPEVPEGTEAKKHTKTGHVTLMK